MAVLFVILLATMAASTTALAGRALESCYQTATREARSGQYEAAIAALGPPLSTLGRQSGGALGQSARTLRGRLLMLTGKFASAAKDWKIIYKNDLFAVAVELAALRKKVMGWHRAANCGKAISAVHELLRHAREDPSLYLLRGECYFITRDLTAAHADASVALSLAPLEPRALLLLARVLYVGVGDLGPDDPAVRSMGKCIRVAPDSSECVVFYKWLQGVNASLTKARGLEEAGEHAEAVAEFKSVLERHDDTGIDTETVNSTRDALQRMPMPRSLRARVIHGLCSLSEALGDSQAIVHWCTQLAMQHQHGEKDPAELITTVRALIYTSRAHMHKHSVSSNRQDLTTASECHSNARALLGDVEVEDDDVSLGEELRVLQSLLSNLQHEIDAARASAEEAKQEDLYSILGVDRHATLAELKSAYRKLALMWHPDKYEGDDPEEATAKFLEIARAFEILSDAARRWHDKTCLHTGCAHATCVALIYPHRPP